MPALEPQRPGSGPSGRAAEEVHKAQVKVTALRAAQRQLEREALAAARKGQPMTLRSLRRRLEEILLARGGAA